MFIWHNTEYNILDLLIAVYNSNEICYLYPKPRRFESIKLCSQIYCLVTEASAHLTEPFLPQFSRVVTSKTGYITAWEMSNFIKEMAHIRGGRQYKQGTEGQWWQNTNSDLCEMMTNWKEKGQWHVHVYRKLTLIKRLSDSLLEWFILLVIAQALLGGKGTAKSQSYLKDSPSLTFCSTTYNHACKKVNYCFNQKVNKLVVDEHKQK